MADDQALHLLMDRQFIEAARQAGSGMKERPVGRDVGMS
jgi:hypothetical protein